MASKPVKNVRKGRMFPYVSYNGTSPAAARVPRSGQSSETSRSSRNRPNQSSVSKLHEWSIDAVVTLPDRRGLLADASPWNVGEKTGDTAGESSIDDTALSRLCTRERVGDDMGETSWSCS